MLGWYDKNEFLYTGVDVLMVLKLVRSCSTVSRPDFGTATNSWTTYTRDQALVLSTIFE